MSQSQAQVYSESSNVQKEDGLNLMSSISFHDGMKVLDLGCGTGCLTSVLAERVGQTGKVVGIDPDKERLAIASKTYGSISNLTFQEGSTDQIPGEGFDAVFANQVFHWVEDKKKAFENVFHCLQPSGLFAICTLMSMKADGSRFINLMDASRVSKLKSILHLLSANEMEELASACGFTVEYKKEFERVYKFNSFDELAKFAYGATGGLIDTQFMDAEKLEKYKRDHEASEEEKKYGLDDSLSFYIFKKKNLI